MALAGDGESAARPGPILIDTDCGLDDLATLALAAASSAPLRLVTTTSGLAPHGHGHLLARRMLDLVGLEDVPVAAGAEAPPPTTVREKQAWEREYAARVHAVTTAMGMETRFDAALARPDRCDAGAAADAMVDAARAAGGGATILALGALTNLAEAVQRHPADFQKLVARVVFIADTDPSRQSYNAALDPAALKVVLGSGTELVLVGSSCYARPAWVEALFEEVRGEGGGTGSGGAACSSPEEGSAQAAAAAACSSPEEGSAQAAAAAAALRTLGGLDPYSMCYDPLALLFHLQPDAFAPAPTPTPVRVRGDIGTADGWRFERCAAEQAEGHVLEPSAVSRERYAAFLRGACGL